MIKHHMKISSKIPHPTLRALNCFVGAEQGRSETNCVDNLDNDSKVIVYSDDSITV